MNLTIDTTNVAQHATQAQQSLAMVKTIIIDDEPSYSSAADVLRQTKSKLKELEAARQAITKPLDAAKASVMLLFKPPTQAMEDCEVLLKNKMSQWTLEQDRRRQLDELAAREAARIECEALELEAVRKESARQALLESAQEQASAGNMQAAQDALALAAKLGEEAKDALLTVGEIAVAPVAMAIKHQGVSNVTRWTAFVPDVMVLVQAVAAGEAPLECLLVNQTFLNQQAVAYKDRLNIVGVKAVSNQSISIR